jgi:uncharacterized protein (TIGR02118 family)
VEHVLIALWRAPNADPSRLLDAWAPIALKHDAVQQFTMSFAVEDQGRFVGGDPVDVLIGLGLETAHDLDDIPERDALYHVAREVKVWRVEPHHAITWDRTWPDGEYAPGVKMVSFLQRAEGLTHVEFSRHWTERHAPLAREHHVGLWNYTQNVVRRAYTPGGAGDDGIAELCFRTRDAFENEFYGSDEGRAAIAADVKRFMAKPRRDAALMRELPLKTPSTAGGKTSV